jgi:hypothetical protein
VKSKFQIITEWCDFLAINRHRPVAKMQLAFIRAYDDPFLPIFIVSFQINLPWGGPIGGNGPILLWWNILRLHHFTLDI